MHRVLSTFLVLLLLTAMFLPSSVAAQNENTTVTGIHVPQGATPHGQSEATPPPAPYSAPASVAPSQNTPANQSCALVNFEGVGNLSSIPTFDGISSPNWLGIIDQDVGGTGNFANEPSPSTVAFWLGGPDGTGSSRDIVFDTPAADVSFYYTSRVTTVIEAYDSNRTLVATARGAANYDRGPGGDPTGRYDRWDLLRVRTTGNQISSIRVYGAINQTGIDNLQVCRSIEVHSVEFTQATQEWQTLSDLQDDLRDDGEPPVPMVAGKPAVMRVYLDEVDATTPLWLTVSGVTNQVKGIISQPGCSPSELRLQQNGCRSVDFYFVPPQGSWSIILQLYDDDGTLINTYDFELTSVTAEPVVLAAVRICDIRDANGNWLCADNYVSRLTRLASLMRKIAPTHSVRVVDSRAAILRNVRAYDTNGDGVLSSNEISNWWFAASRDVHGLFTLSDWLADALGMQDTRYHGMVRSDMPGTINGMANGIPSRGSLSKVVALSSTGPNGKDMSATVVAHEVFHTMGRYHTATDVPQDKCWPSVAPKPWPYPDSTIQNTGFDLTTGRVIPAATTFDVMSYCEPPTWISPYTYNGLLRGALETSVASVKIQQAALGSFWQVSGVITQNSVHFDPLFALETAGPSGTLTGTHRIEVRNAAGTVLFSRAFTPISSESFVSDGGDAVSGPPFFSELIPVQQGATRLVVLGSNNAELGALAFGGAVPSVSLAFPAGGETLSGIQTLAWSVSDTDSTSHTFRVQYASDGGAKNIWENLVSDISEPKLTVNFDQLAGSAGTARVRVLVSDGVNSSVATSAPFSVTSKPPIVTIEAPDSGAIFQAGALVWLQGLGFDAEDGALEGQQLRWSSNLSGDLGSGESLPMTTLAEGQHTITLTATDKVGNTATATTTLVVDGTGPELTLIAQPDAIPTSCVAMRIRANDAGSGLDSLQYSLNGGDTWVPAPSQDFAITQTGYFHIIAQATDKAGNYTVKEQRLFVGGTCTRPLRISFNMRLPVVLNRSSEQSSTTPTPTSTPTPIVTPTPTGVPAYLDPGSPELRR